MTYSTIIDDVIELAKNDGNAVADITTGWSKVREVVYMRGPITAELYAKLTQDSRLRVWKTEATPHNNAEIGFTDDDKKVAISFPVPKLE